MSLINKYNNNETRFLDLKFTGDRPEGASSNEPYLYKNLPYVRRYFEGTGLADKPFANFNNVLKPLNQLDSDSLNRGGASLLTHSLNDSFRIFRKLFDNKNIGGFLFSTKQLLLSRSSVLTQASPSIVGFGIAPRPNQGRYNIFKPIAQAAGVGFGLHFDKFGRPLQSVRFPSRAFGDAFSAAQDAENDLGIDTGPYGLFNPGLELPTEPRRYLDVVGPFTQYDYTKYGPLGSNSIPGFTQVRFRQQLDDFIQSNGEGIVYTQIEGPDIRTTNYEETDFNLFGRDTVSTNLALQQIYFNGRNFSTFFATRNFKKDFTTIKERTNRVSPNIFSYEGGPGSFAGFGSTNIKFSTDRAGIPIRDLYIKYPRELHRYFNPNDPENYLFLTRLPSQMDANIDPYNQSLSNKIEPTLIDFRAFSNNYETIKNSFNPLITFTDGGQQLFSKSTVHSAYYYRYDKAKNKSKSYTDGSTLLRGRNFINLKGDDNVFNPELYSILAIKLFGTGFHLSAIPALKGNQGKFEDDVPVNKAGASLRNDVQYFPFRLELYDPISKTSTTLMFDAFLGDLTDSYSNDWSTQNYVGRNETFFKFNGKFERKISLNWKIVAFAREHIVPIYTKLNLLASSMAGTYTTAGFPAGMLVKLTVGDLIVNQWGFIRNLAYTFKEGNPWDLKEIDRTSFITDAYNEHVFERNLAGRSQAGYEFDPESGEFDKIDPYADLPEYDILGQKIELDPFGKKDQAGNSLVPNFMSQWIGLTSNDKAESLTTANQNYDVQQRRNAYRKMVLRLCKYVDISSFDFQCIHNFRPEYDNFSSTYITKPFLMGDKHKKYADAVATEQKRLGKQSQDITYNDTWRYSKGYQTPDNFNLNYGIEFQDQDRSARVARRRLDRYEAEQSAQRMQDASRAFIDNLGDSQGSSQIPQNNFKDSPADPPGDPYTNYMYNQ